jgi:hypothetical protein
MKAKVHKLIGTAVLGLALFSQGLPARAGVAVRKEVYISLSGTDVQGSLPGARYSKDAEQYIGCTQYRETTYNTSFVHCHARDNKGRSVLCASRDPRIADAVKGMTDSSDLRITIGRDPLGGALCSELTVSNESIYLP